MVQSLGTLGRTRTRALACLFLMRGLSHAWRGTRDEFLPHFLAGMVAIYEIEGRYVLLGVCGGVQRVEE
jgi:hypothetical protein